MESTQALALLVAIVVAVLFIRYWRQIIAAFLVSMVAVFCFGILQLASIVDI